MRNRGLRINIEIVCLAALLSLTGCASINSVSLTSIPAGRGREINAKGSRLIFLGLNFNNDFVDEMTDDLKRQCEGGQVKGILTKDETIQYFLFFLYQRRVTATAYCLGKRGDVALSAEENAR